MIYTMTFNPSLDYVIRAKKNWNLEKSADNRKTFTPE